MAYRQSGRRSPFKTVFLVILCSLAGGAIVFWMSPHILNLARNARQRGLMPKAERTAAREVQTSDGGLDKMNRTGLEREVRRLRSQLTEKETELETRERENAELKLRIKLLMEGSRTKD